MSGINIKTRTTWFKVLASGAILTLAGCILSATLTIIFELDNPTTFSSSAAFNAAAVDLTEEEDWDDNKDKIDRIESIRMDGVVTNNLGSNYEFTIWISNSNYANSTDLTNATDKYALVSGLPFEAGPVTDTFTLAQTEQYLVTDAATLEKIKQVALDGTFYVYLQNTAGAFNLTLEEGNIIVTFTASK